jgi:hypothetical protein
MSYCSNPNELKIILHNNENENYLNLLYQSDEPININSINIMISKQSESHSNMSLDLLGSNLTRIASFDTLNSFDLKNYKTELMNSLSTQHKEEKCRCENSTFKLRVGAANSSREYFLFKLDENKFEKKSNNIYDKHAELVFKTIAGYIELRYLL